VTTPEEALKMLASEHFDILFTDYKLPGMDGLTLARKAKLEHPQIVILLSSGYGDITADTPELGAPILSKPFSLGALRKAIK
jgi:CheY-like chemotaxis protein